MKVKAVSLGFDNLTLREPGEVFDMPDDTEVTPVKEGGWFTKVDDAEQADDKPAPKGKAKA